MVSSRSKFKKEDSMENKTLMELIVKREVSRGVVICPECQNLEILEYFKEHDCCSRCENKKAA